MPQYDTSQLQQLIAHSNKLLIILPQNPSLDHLAAGLALHLSLLKTHKEVQTFTPTAVTVEHNRLIGINQVINQLTGHNLIISLPQQQENIERVYTEINPQTRNFEIIIEPRKGFPSPNHQTISYAYQGYKSDVIFFLDTKHPEDFTNFDADYFQSLIDSTHLVHISTSPDADHPKTYEFVDQQASSISEIIANILQGLHFDVDNDIATNILAGIEHRTSGLTAANLTAQTFEIVAWCLRMGAVRGYTQAIQPLENIVATPSTAEPKIITTENKAVIKEKYVYNPLLQSNEEVDSIQLTTQSIQDQPAAIPSSRSPSRKISSLKSNVPDWLIPKIVTKAD